MSAAPIVTLTTDWSTTDFFPGMVKARLYSSIPDVRVVDVSHGVSRFDLSAAAMIVKQACFNFPSGTIHIIDCDGACSSDTVSIVACYKGQYYIMTDNGLPNLVFGNDSVEAYTLSSFTKPLFRNNLVCDVYCKAAAMIAAGSPLSDFGESYPSLKMCTLYEWTCQDNKVRAYISYVDSYGNACLNMTYDDFERIRAGRRFKLLVGGLFITEMQYGYHVDNHSNLLMLTVSSNGLLQLAVSQNSAANLLGLQLLQMVVITFF